MVIVIACIYKITNIVNNKIYIGSSVNYRKRWHDHVYQLNKNIHSNKHLQNAWNKYGEINFKFDIIENCDDDKKYKREQYYLDNLKPFSPNGYNISTLASGGVCEITEGFKEKVIQCKIMLKHGYSPTEISRELKMAYDTVFKIVILRKYSEIAEEYNVFLLNFLYMKNMKSKSILLFRKKLQDLLCDKNKTKDEQEFIKNAKDLFYNYEFNKNRIKDIIVQDEYCFINSNNYQSDYYLYYSLKYKIS